MMRIIIPIIRRRSGTSMSGYFLIKPFIFKYIKTPKNKSYKPETEQSRVYRKTKYVHTAGKN